MQKSLQDIKTISPQDMKIKSILELKIKGCKQVIIKNLQKGIQPKTIFMFIQSKKLSNQIKTYSLNPKDNTAKIQFYQHEKALQFYDNYSFTQKILTRGFNISLNLGILGLNQTKKYSIFGITQEKQISIFKIVRKFGICNINTTYNQLRQINSKGVITIIRQDQLSKQEYKQLQSQLNNIEVNLSQFLDANILKCTITLSNFYKTYNRPNDLPQITKMTRVNSVDQTKNLPQIIKMTKTNSLDQRKKTSQLIDIVQRSQKKQYQHQLQLLKGQLKLSQQKLKICTQKALSQPNNKIESHLSIQLTQLQHKKQNLLLQLRNLIILMDKQKIEGCQEIIVGRVERIVRKIVGEVVQIHGMEVKVRVQDKAGNVGVKVGLDWLDPEITIQRFIKLNQALSQTQIKVDINLHHFQQNTYYVLITTGIYKTDQNLSNKQFQLMLLESFKTINEDVIQVRIYPVEYNQTYVAKVYLRKQTSGKDFLVKYPLKRQEIFKFYKNPNKIIFDMNFDREYLNKVHRAEKKANQIVNNIKNMQIECKKKYYQNRAQQPQRKAQYISKNLKNQYHYERNSNNNYQKPMKYKEKPMKYKEKQ